MNEFFALVVVGLTTGSVYAITATGLVLTYKTSGVFNFAHGAQAAAAAYVMYTLREQQGWPWPLAALAALLLVGVLAGLLLERLAHALSGASPTAAVVAAVGLLIAIQGVLVLAYGPTAIPVAPFLPEAVVSLPGVNVRASQIIEIGVALAAAGSVFALFRWTRIGVAMQAVVDNPSLLGLLGTSPAAVRRWAWVIGSVFAALSGILLAPTVTLDVTVLTLLVVAAFGAAAIGGFDSLPATYAGAIAIGLAVAILPDYLGEFAPLAGQATFPFLVLFGVLLLRPNRLAQPGGKRTAPSAALMQVPARLARAAKWAGPVVLLLPPLFAGAGLGMYTRALAFAILFASLGLLVRTSGQVSLCQMVFAAVGAVVFAHAAAAGVPWPLAVLAGGLAAAPIGAIVAVPAMRLAGIYLAIATFGFGILAERIFYGTRVMFGGGGSLPAPAPDLPLTGSDGDVAYYYTVLLIAGACLALVVAVQRARLGRLLNGLAESPLALATHGVNIRLTRLYVFCVSAFLAGVAGAVLGPVTGVATASGFDFLSSLMLVAVLAISGRHSVLSPFVAAIAVTVIPWVIENQTLVDAMPVLFGLAAITAAVAASRSGGLGRGMPVRALQRMQAPAARRDARPYAQAGVTP